MNVRADLANINVSVENNSNREESVDAGYEVTVNTQTVSLFISAFGYRSLTIKENYRGCL